MTLKLATTLDGRVTVPGRRWVTGEQAAGSSTSCALPSTRLLSAPGMVRADDPQLTARGVDVPRRPRRLVFGTTLLPEGSDLELRPGRLEDELATLAAEGVQSLLLEGGPTLATAFLERGLVDKLLLFVAPSSPATGFGCSAHSPCRSSPCAHDGAADRDRPADQRLCPRALTT